MSRREDREQKATQWLEHLRAWKESGLPLSAYARERGLAVWSAHQWRARLVQRGLWPAEPRITKSAHVHALGGSPRAPLHFARVRLEQEAIPTRALLVRVQLANGRRTEIELAEISQVGELLRLLEHPA